MNCNPHSYQVTISIYHYSPYLIEDELLEHLPARWETSFYKSHSFFQRASIALNLWIVLHNIVSICNGIQLIIDP